MVRVLALLGAALTGAYGVSADLIRPGEILDLPAALLAFAAASVVVLVTLRLL